jgi:N-acetylmuramoyl-L-alanine amidase
MKRIWHDEAHGGRNLGIQFAGISEKKWTPVIARDVAAMLKCIGGVEQRFARDGQDIDLDYDTRAEDALRWGADFAMLHHANGGFFDDGTPRVSMDGLICFHPRGDWKGREVGDAMMRAAPYDLLRTKHKSYPASKVDWTEDAYAHLHHYSDRNIPAVLVEWCFLTAPRDVAVLEDVRSRPAMCASAVCGIARLFELD